jgi:hypothetical protein
MIVKDYYQNINVHKPRDYFERWYADVWKRRISKFTAPPGIVEMIMDEELESVGARYESTENGYRFRVYFDKDQDYTMFVLRWS